MDTRVSDTTDWFDDDSFWDVLAPFLFNEERWLSITTQVDQLIELAGLSSGMRILDLCCGPGRHSLELTRRGYQVTGVDRTESYIKLAKERAELEDLEIEFVLSDMREYCRPESFDCVVNLFTSFGYFKDPEDDRRVLRNVYDSLRESGVFVLDMVGKEILARKFRPRDWQEVNGLILLEERNITENWSWMENRWIVLKGSERHDFNISHRIYSAVELGDLLDGVGFHSVKLFGNLSGILYDQNAERLVAVGYKS